MNVEIPPNTGIPTQNVCVVCFSSACSSVHSCTMHQLQSSLFCPVLSTSHQWRLRIGTHSTCVYMRTVHTTPPSDGGTHSTVCRAYSTYHATLGWGYTLHMCVHAYSTYHATLGWGYTLHSVPCVQYIPCHPRWGTHSTCVHMHPVHSVSHRKTLQQGARGSRQFIVICFTVYSCSL